MPSEKRSRDNRRKRAVAIKDAISVMNLQGELRDAFRTAGIEDEVRREYATVCEDLRPILLRYLSPRQTRRNLELMLPGLLGYAVFWRHNPDHKSREHYLNAQRRNRNAAPPGSQRQYFDCLLSHLERIMTPMSEAENG
jgi:hypothetical protein